MWYIVVVVRLVIVMEIRRVVEVWGLKYKN